MVWIKLQFSTCLANSVLFKRHYSLTLITFSRTLCKFLSIAFFLLELFLVNPSLRQHSLTHIVYLGKFDQSLSKAHMVRFGLYLLKFLWNSDQDTRRFGPYCPFKGCFFKNNPWKDNMVQMVLYLGLSLPKILTNTTQIESFIYQKEIDKLFMGTYKFPWKA